MAGTEAADPDRLAGPGYDRRRMAAALRHAIGSRAVGPDQPLPENPESGAFEGKEAAAASSGSYARRRRLPSLLWQFPETSQVQRPSRLDALCSHIPEERHGPRRHQILREPLSFLFDRWGLSGRTLRAAASSRGDGQVDFETSSCDLNFIANSTITRSRSVSRLTPSMSPRTKRRD